MATEYASLDAIVADICKAYFRPLHSTSDGTSYNTSLDYTNCSKDLGEILFSGYDPAAMFFIKTKSDDYFANSTVEYFMVYFYKDESNGFKYSTNSSNEIGIVGVIKGNTSTEGSSTYTFENTSLLYGIKVEYSNSSTDRTDTFKFTVSYSSNEVAYTLVCTYDESNNLSSVTTGDNVTFTPMDPNTTFGLVSTGLTEEQRISYFYNQYNDNQSPAVANNDIYAGKNDDKTYNYLLQSVNDTIPLENTLISSGFSAIVVVEDEMSYQHSLYMKITGVSAPNEQGISIWTGSMTEYGCGIEQQVSLDYNTGNNKILFTYVNGYFENNWLGYSIDVYFIGKKIDNASSGSMLPLLYEEKTLTKESTYYYMDSASQVARGFYGSYSQFDHLYPLTTGGTVTDDTSTTVVTGYRVYNGNNAMYRFSESMVDCSYNNTSNNITQLDILESYLTETIEDIEYPDVNIRYIRDGSGNYGLLPADITNITVSNRLYFVSALSDLIFQWDNRYCDLEYFVDNSGTILTMTDSGISIKSGDAPFFCTMKERDLFVSYCFTESQMIPSVTGTTSIEHPAKFNGIEVSDSSDYTLVQYNANFLKNGYETGTAATTISGDDKKNIAKVLTKDNYKNTIVYIQIGLQNVDAKPGSTADECVVYFDTEAGFESGTTKKKMFYGYLVVYTDSRTVEGNINLIFVHNLDDDDGSELDTIIYPTVDTESTTFKADLNELGFSITFGEDAITVEGYQEIFPANMALSNSTLVDNTTSVKNAISNYAIMAVYTKGNTPSPTPSTTDSRISTYSNICYLEDGEYNSTNYNTNLKALITGASDLTQSDDVDWRGYSEIILSYTMSKDSFRTRLFTVGYTFDSSTHNVIKLTLYKFSNKGETSLKDCVCQKISMNKAVKTKYDGTEIAVKPSSFTSSSLTVDVTINYISASGYSLTYTDYWYNHLGGTSPTATIVSLLGVA